MKMFFTILLLVLSVDSHAQSCGPLDSAFGTAGKTFAVIVSGPSPESKNLIIQPDNKILQPISVFTGSHYDLGLLRYKSNGLLDSAFGTNGRVTTAIGTSDSYARDGALQVDGKIVIAGSALTSSNYWGFALVRYNSNGTLDSSFGSNGKVVTSIGTYDQVSGLAIQPDGKIVVVGTSYDDYYSGTFAVARYKTNGNLDSTFGQNGKIVKHLGPFITYIGNQYYGRYADENARAVVVQTNGKIVVVGKSYVYNACYDDYYGGIYCNSAFAMFRLQTNGDIDSSFGNNGKITDSVSLLQPESAVLQTDGKIIVTGSGYNSGFITERYDSNGIPDSSFGSNGIVITQPASNSNSWAHSATMRSDGKIVVAGTVSAYSIYDFAVVRYNNNGTVDSTLNGNGLVVFHLGQQLSYEEATGVGILNNKIIVGGISRLGSSGSTAIARLLENGQTLTPVIKAGGPLNFCIGGSVRLSSSETGTIQWYKNDFPISGATDTVLFVYSEGIYRVSVSNSNGCGTSSPVVVTIATSFIPTITPNGPTNICIGNSVVLTSSAYGGNQWYKDGIAISGATNNSLTVTTTGTYTVKNISNGCESVASNSIIVTVNPIIPATPVITAGGVTAFCNGSSVVLTSTATSNNQWYKNGVIINGETATTLNVTTSGSFAAKVVESGCESAVSNTITVTVNNPPVKPPIIWNTPEFSTTAGYAHYQWSLNNAPIPGVDSNVYKPLQTGLYNVSVTDNNDCKNTSDNFNLILLAVSDITIGDSKLRYYPNPARTVLYIDISNSILNKLKAELYDQLGKLVHTQLLNQSHNEMALQKLSVGVYQLVIHDKTKRVSVKLIVTR